MTEHIGINAIISRALEILRSDKIFGPRLSNTWLPAATFAEAIMKSGHVDATLTIDARKFNVAMSKSASFGDTMTRFDGSNHTGVFRICYGKQYFYYLTDSKRQAPYPNPLNSAWKERVLQAGVNVLAIPSTRARPASESTCTVDATGKTNDMSAVPGIATDIYNENKEESANKRQRVSDNDSYWPCSPEAGKLFLPRKQATSRSAVIVGPGMQSRHMTNIETPKEAVERRIRALKLVQKSEDSWRNVIIGRDVDNYCTKAEVFEICQRALFLCCAYQLALTHMTQWTWFKCCQEACDQLNGLGLMQGTCYKTVAGWNKTFRQYECFPHPNPYVQCGKRPLPRLLEVFPDAKDQIVAYAIKNLASLTIEGVHDFIVSTVLPRLVSTWQKDVAASTSDTSAAT